MKNILPVFPQKETLPNYFFCPNQIVITRKREKGKMGGEIDQDMETFEIFRDVGNKNWEAKEKKSSTLSISRKLRVTDAKDGRVSKLFELFEYFFTIVFGKCRRGGLIVLSLL